MHTNQIFIGNKLFCRFLSILVLAGMIILLSPKHANAQEQDSTATDSIIHNHSPRKAVLYSLICPGLGQIYNKKYWKIPFIYGGGGAFLYYINYNQLKYRKFRNAYDIAYQNFKKTGTKDNVVIDGFTYRYEALPLGRDWYRRYRDWSVAGLAAIYLLNVIDAMVDATFYYYDISDDLSMKIEPSFMDGPGLTSSMGLSIKLRF